MSSDHAPLDDSSGIQLLDDLLKLVMHHVPLSYRLTVGALVCSKYRKAAVAATTSITVKDVSQEQCDGIVSWLKHHGTNVKVSSISLSGQASLSELPCPSLESLYLD